MINIIVEIKPDARRVVLGCLGNRQLSIDLVATLNKMGRDSSQFGIYGSWFVLVDEKTILDASCLCPVQSDSVETK